ncbi:uncharacterized protein LOC129740088 [Uranotaenia lowii]|uniref:uncharacterized protein LOC129740088 n=1 Tax=Uranotaenia lowii TaxID=190385 RepID=UPI00247A9BF7|nr:uncharacterized protein LOC129740088 [Uranotaenia lowii]
MSSSAPTFVNGNRDGLDESDEDDRENDDQFGDNFLKLALNKPKSWKWELTTSSSSSSINFPRIQLIDSRTGELMVEVDKPDCVVKSEQFSNGEVSPRSSTRYRRSKSSCLREKVIPSSSHLSDVFEQLQNKGMGHKLSTSALLYKNGDINDSNHSIHKSKSASEVRQNSPGSEQVGWKRRIRKSSSSRSNSILGRISEFRQSSTEDEPIKPKPSTPPPPSKIIPPAPTIIVEEDRSATPQQVQQATDKPKIYKLVRSNAGTLMVREESFHTRNSIRRRQQQESHDQQTKTTSNNHLEKRITIADIPESSYDQTINEIDKLISKVMLSHNLQDVVTQQVEAEKPTTINGSHSPQQHPDKQKTKKRKSRQRSASVGSSNGGSMDGSRQESRSSRRSSNRNSPIVTVGSSSDDEELSLAESRFGSLKRRGRPRYRRNNTGTPTTQSVVAADARLSTEERRQIESNESVCIEECESMLLSTATATVHRRRRSRHRRSLSSGGEPTGSQLTLEPELPVFETRNNANNRTESSRSKSSSTSLSTLSPPSGVEPTTVDQQSTVTESQLKLDDKKLNYGQSELIKTPLEDLKESILLKPQFVTVDQKVEKAFDDIAKREPDRKSKYSNSKTKDPFADFDQTDFVNRRLDSMLQQSLAFLTKAKDDIRKIDEDYSQFEQKSRVSAFRSPTCSTLPLSENLQVSSPVSSPTTEGLPESIQRRTQKPYARRHHRSSFQRTCLN